MCVELHTLDLMIICIIHVHMYLYNMYMYVNRLNLTQGASPIRTGTTLGHAMLIICSLNVCMCNLYYIHVHLSVPFIASPV